mmetsp:Transcript_72525/g.201102  ORF Transcript_72525/g.201102 Transcript_72525/m.201102 type:complete len:987 (+) Transcript_72525:80-3040(+)
MAPSLPEEDCVHIRILSVHDLPQGPPLNVYVVARVGFQEQRTTTIRDSLEPCWENDDHDLVFSMRGGADELELEVLHERNVFESGTLGRAEVTTWAMAPNQWHRLHVSLSDGAMSLPTTLEFQVLLEVDRFEHAGPSPVPADASVSTLSPTGASPATSSAPAVCASPAMVSKPIATADVLRSEIAAAEAELRMRDSELQARKAVATERSEKHISVGRSDSGAVSAPTSRAELETQLAAIMERRRGLQASLERRRQRAAQLERAAAELAEWHGGDLEACDAKSASTPTRCSPTQAQDLRAAVAFPAAGLEGPGPEQARIQGPGHFTRGSGGTDSTRPAEVPQIPLSKMSCSAQGPVAALGMDAESISTDCSDQTRQASAISEMVCSGGPCRPPPCKIAEPPLGMSAMAPDGIGAHPTSPTRPQQDNGSSAPGAAWVSLEATSPDNAQSVSTFDTTVTARSLTPQMSPQGPAASEPALAPPAVAPADVASLDTHHGPQTRCALEFAAPHLAASLPAAAAISAIAMATCAGVSSQTAGHLAASHAQGMPAKLPLCYDASAASCLARDVSPRLPPPHHASTGLYSKQGMSEAAPLAHDAFPKVRLASETSPRSLAADISGGPRFACDALQRSPVAFEPSASCRFAQDASPNHIFLPDTLARVPPACDRSPRSALALDAYTGGPLTWNSSPRFHRDAAGGLPLGRDVSLKPPIDASIRLQPTYDTSAGWRFARDASPRPPLANDLSGGQCLGCDASPRQALAPCMSSGAPLFAREASPRVALSHGMSGGLPTGRDASPRLALGRDAACALPLGRDASPRLGHDMAGGLAFGHDASPAFPLAHDRVTGLQMSHSSPALHRNASVGLAWFAQGTVAPPAALTTPAIGRSGGADVRAWTPTRATVSPRRRGMALGAEVASPRQCVMVGLENVSLCAAVSPRRGDASFPRTFAPPGYAPAPPPHVGVSACAPPLSLPQPQPQPQPQQQPEAQRPA